MNPAVTLSTGPVTIHDLVSVARGNARVELDAAASQRLRDAADLLQRAASDGQAHYGVNTGFGSLSRQRIPDDSLRALQLNLVRSHAAGVGEPLPADAVRGMMLLLAASLSRGFSGVRPEVVTLILDCLNEGITPVVPSIGSVGASGDLAPLAHAVLVLLGEGRARLGNEVLPGEAALRRAGLSPITLGAKEGLALINGTHLMAAQAALALHDFDRVLAAALVATAMSIDACRATDTFLDERLHGARNQPGQAWAAERIRTLLEGSEILPSHAVSDPRVQDPYSLRCAPAVLGAIRDLTGYVKHAARHELGAVTDNPLVVHAPDGSPEILSGGNFHGMPIALPLDTLAIACAHLAGIAERRLYHMLSGFDPESHLPPFLSPDPGLHSGFMIAQYSAAACCNELIGLAAPASVANLSTSAGMEDYNSFGPRSAAKARRAVSLARSVVAIELLCAAEAIERHRPLKSGAAVERVHAQIRGVVPRLIADRELAPDIQAVEHLIESGVIASASGLPD